MILITGANGFLGSRIVEHFYKYSQNDILALWNNSNNRMFLKSKKSLQYLKCDLKDAENVKLIFSNFPISSVLHCAALLPNQNKENSNENFVTNVLSTINLADAARQNGVGLFVNCSSISVYPNNNSLSKLKEIISPKPFEFYGWSKFTGEEYLRLLSNKDFKVVNLRLAGVHGIGRDGGVVYNFCKSAFLDKPINIVATGQSIQILFIDDAVNFISAAIKFKPNKIYENFNIASHSSITLEKLARQIINLAKSRSKIILGNDSPNLNQIMDISKSINIFNERPKIFEKSLVKTLLSIKNLEKGNL